MLFSLKCVCTKWTTEINTNGSNVNSGLDVSSQVQSLSIVVGHTNAHMRTHARRSDLQQGPKLTSSMCVDLF